MDILTFTPMQTGLLLKTGVSPGTPKFLRFLRSLPQHSPSVVYPTLKKDRGPRYNKLEEDSYDLRLFVWEHRQRFKSSNGQAFSVEVHVYSTNMAIAEVRLYDVEQQQADTLEKWCQDQTEAILRDVFPNLRNFLKRTPFHNSEFLYDQEETEFDIQQKLEKIDRCSRAIILTEEERSDPDLHPLLSEWLKDTNDPKMANALISGDINSAMTWVNYVLVTREHGEFERHVSAMRIAQYFWSAQEWVNDNAHASISWSMEQRRVARAEKRLRGTRTRMQMLQIELNHASAHINRKRYMLIQNILDGWRFDKLLETGNLLVELSNAQLEDIAERNRKTSSVITDTLLVGLSVFAFLEVLLYILEFSREYMLRPSLALEDDARSRFLTRVSEIDIDTILWGSLMVMMLTTICCGFIFFVTRRYRK